MAEHPPVPVTDALHADIRAFSTALLLQALLLVQRDVDTKVPEEAP